MKLCTQAWWSAWPESNFAGAAASLGLERSGAGCLVPLLGGDYLVGPQGVSRADGGEAFITHRIVLAWYLLHGGSGEPCGSMIPYRDLCPGGAKFRPQPTNPGVPAPGRGLRGPPAGAQARGPPPWAARSWRPPAPMTGPGASRPCPKLPLELRFYDADEEFPAEAKMLYDMTAPNFLDMECLAALAYILVWELEQAGEKP